MRRTSKSFGGARTCLRSSITVPSLVWLGFHPPPQITLSFLSVCLSIRHASFAPLIRMRRSFWARYKLYIRLDSVNAALSVYARWRRLFYVNFTIYFH